ncbi:unnamed protein product, partial [Ectocarpus fasciculatus]
MESALKNPYSPPAAALAADHPDVIARMRLIAIESNVKSIGILFLLQGLFALFDVLILGRNPGNPLYSTPGELNFDDEASLQRLLWSLTLIPGTLSGYLLYQLNGSKPGLTVLCCLPVSLFCGLIGPVLVGHTTWALYSKKGKHIFSTDYKELIERTPNI